MPLTYLRDSPTATGTQRFGAAPASTRRETLIMLLLAFALLAVRNPALLLHGRLWAEEGTVYLRFAWENAFWHALVAHHQGYYALLPNLVGLVAARALPLSAAALLFVWTAALVQLLAAWLIFDADIFTSFPTKLLAVAVVLLVPSSAEVWLNVANSQLYLLLCSLAMLLSFRAQAYKNVLLAFASLTGVLSCLLCPFFLAKGFLLRTRTAISQAVISLCCTLVQLGVVLAAGARENPHQLQYVGEAALVKNVFLPFTSVVTAYHVSDLLRAHAAAGIVGAPFVFLCFFAALLALGTRGGWPAVTLLGIGLCVESFSVLTGLEMHATVIRPYANNRYFLMLNVCVGLALVCVLQNAQAQRLRRVSLVLLVCLLASGVLDFYKSRPFTAAGPRWAPQITQWHRQPALPLHVAPDKWENLYLTPTPEELTLPDDSFDSTNPHQLRQPLAP